MSTHQFQHQKYTGFYFSNSRADEGIEQQTDIPDEQQLTPAKLPLAVKLPVCWLSSETS